MSDDSNIATHDAPAAPADFLIRVDLANHGMPDKIEQLWARRLAPDRFEIASIPFFAYGIALGDIVQTVQESSSEFVVDHVAERSGHLLLRVGLTAYQTIPELHELLHREILRSGLKYEWHRAEYVAVDLPSRDLGNPLIEYLEPLAKMHKLAFELLE